MGFPRVLGKTNKVYTKLGELCLSNDGSVWLICHTCQQELHSQDHFFKHIQDEHNFLAGIKQEIVQRTIAHTPGGTVYNITETETSLPLPLPLYRKLNDEEQRVVAAEQESNNSRDQSEPKDYTDMRGIESNAVEIDIKVEPQSLHAHHAQQSQQQQQQITQVNAITTPSTTLYHAIPQLGSTGGGGGGVSSGASGHHTYATIVPSMPQMTMATMVGQNTSTVGALATVAAAAQHHQELNKDGGGGVSGHNNNNNNNNTSGAVSSEDGERWYVCDYETCGLKFKYQSRLELHKSVHSKERRFACELCGASFKQSCNLSTHRKKKHSIKGMKSNTSGGGSGGTGSSSAAMMSHFN